MAQEARDAARDYSPIAASDFGDLAPSKAASDWNDLAKLKGRDIAKAQLLKVVVDI